MTSDDFLINHAYKHVWCAPEQDRQTILRPMRITSSAAVRTSVTILWKNYLLPKPETRYHVFQLGNIAQSTLGLKLQPNVWTACSTQMVANGMLIDVYTERGLMIPREHAFLMTTFDGNIVLCVEALPEIGNFGIEDVYIRFYSNVFFDRADNQLIGEDIEYYYNIPTNASQISSLTYKLNDIKTRPGYVFLYVNGWAVNNITAAVVKRGDRVEMVRDSSVLRVEEMAIADLPVFLSELDAKQKYLIHPDVIENEDIFYRDDQEFFLMHKETANIHRGVFYHKNQEDAVRMVTHRDYSIPTHYVDRYTALNPGWVGSDQLTLKIILRRGGMDKALLHEAHHIKDLYKFEGADWFKSVVGSEAVVDVWRVEQLEKSMYTALMRAKSGTITRPMVEDAYGYNTISRLLADTPQKISTPKQWVELPFGLRGESTIYEYDGNGLLLGWYHNQRTQFYVPRSPECRYIEGIVGRGSDILSTVYGRDYRPDPSYSYRCYVCSIVSGLPRGDWKDVTGDEDYYILTDGEIQWKTDPENHYTAIKIDDSFLTYNLNLDYQDKLLRFTMNVKEFRWNGQLYNGLVEIQPGLIELWLNGHGLIEGLDWFQEDDEICIVNRQYRNQGQGGDTITVRATGFCHADMSRIQQAEYGFVEQGILSRNNRWNLRDDKVVRVVADGRLWSREELSWDEDRPEVVLTQVRDGAPYKVIEPPIPLRDVTLEETYALRQLALDTDLQIEDYMTVHMGETTVPDYNPISHRHQLCSPFISKLMYDLKNGFFGQHPLHEYYDDKQLREWVEPYIWLLTYEPTRKALDWRYVDVYPHESVNTVYLNVYQYNFLSRAVRLILDDKVKLTNHVAIDTGE